MYDDTSRIILPPHGFFGSPTVDRSELFFVFHKNHKCFSPEILSFHKLLFLYTINILIKPLAEELKAGHCLKFFGRIGYEEKICCKLRTAEHKTFPNFGVKSTYIQLAPAKRPFIFQPKDCAHIQAWGHKKQTISPRVLSMCSLLVERNFIFLGTFLCPGLKVSRLEPDRFEICSHASERRI